ncbi:MAG: DUF723 domain-containing protein [Thaumarchaeota archaeon]|nr:DUF723 domain-containing protein [Nitrososphaerota archaeon]
MTPTQFIRRASAVHGTKYDYSEIQFVHSQEKVPIICRKHGRFLQSPQKHLSGQGCKKCSFEELGLRSRSSKEQFIERAIKIHGPKYSYDKVDYRNSYTKVTITCPIHGDFQMISSNHTHKTLPQGCPECGGKTRWTREKFIQESKKKHAERYSYFKVKFESVNRPVIIICPAHGDFQQKPSKHLNGQGCPVCAGTKKGTTQQFIEKANSIWGDKYNYDKVVYLRNHQKVTITCPIHGDFEMTPANHTHKSSPQGCPRCSGKRVRTTSDFIAIAGEVHDDLYDYTRAHYIDSQTPLEIICPFHGPFNQKPNVHLHGSGCPKCRLSRGEHRIEEELKRLGVDYTNQQSFPDCRNKNPLPFDFQVNVDGIRGLIEFNGKQHYSKLNGFFDLQLIQKRDSIKRRYCEKNNIPLLVISYEEYSDIDRKVLHFIKSLK